MSSESDGRRPTDDRRAGPNEQYYRSPSNTKSERMKYKFQRLEAYQMALVLAYD